MIYQNVIFFITLFQDFLCCIAVLGYYHRQSRGFRREEHTAAHVLCLFEPIGRVTQSMGEKACAANRKRSMSAGIAVDSSVKGMMRSKFPCAKHSDEPPTKQEACSPVGSTLPGVSSP